ncbi:uncharacterized protein LOC143544767 [Bidens hawaiensis]|uniref:uncharacterized protein LOC143544767 n=1 Tax=Bidens hawaiensis TaxID=980011 RepID=UPI00404A327E
MNMKRGRKISTTSNIQSSTTSLSSLTTQQSNQQPQLIVVDIFSGVSKDYLDHGDQNVVCVICHAKLWKEEVKRGQNKIAKGSYSLCCRYGKVELPEYIPSNPGYENLFRGSDATSKYFLKNIRRYNSMFSFTSMRGKIYTAINRGKGPFVFRLSGQNYHSIGSLQPEPGCKPKFSQLYIYDTDNELTNRQKIFCDSKNMSTEAANAMDLQIIQRLKEMLDSQNVLVKTYRMARDSLQENPHIDLKLRLIANRQKDGRTYNLPTTSEVAALIVGDISDSLQPRDILVTTMDGKIIPISELHPSYVPLQYPIIFINGEDGYRVNIYHRGVNVGDDSKRPFTTMRECQQTKLRSSTYDNLMNLRDQGTSSVSKVGRAIILSSSFTEVTCNPKWPEVTRFLKDTTLNSKDRPDILCRLFKIKLDALLKDLKDKAVLSKVQAIVYTIEFQKRGLPHAHMCLFMHVDHKLPVVEHDDPFIYAEIPDKNEDPELHYLVSELMIHGQCGAHNPTCSCMFDNKCSKKIPKNFRDATSVDSQGYPQYRRRDSGQFVQKGDIQLDNRSVVPYNKYLLK